MIRINILVWLGALIRFGVISVLGAAFVAEFLSGNFLDAAAAGAPLAVWAWWHGYRSGSAR